MRWDHDDEETITLVVVIVVVAVVERAFERSVPSIRVEEMVCCRLLYISMARLVKGKELTSGGHLLIKNVPIAISLLLSI